MNPQQNLGLQFCVETADGKFSRFILLQINVRLLDLREGHKVTRRQSKNIRVFFLNFVKKKNKKKRLSQDFSVVFCCSWTRKDPKSTKEQLTELQNYIWKRWWSDKTSSFCSFFLLTDVFFQDEAWA